jgi:hypothetical protein
LYEFTQACIELPLVLALTEMSPVEFTTVVQELELPLYESNNVPPDNKLAEMQCNPTLRLFQVPSAEYMCKL